MPKKDNHTPALIRETENGKEKYCSACKDYHPATEEYFYNDGRSSTGLTSWCKKATRTKQKMYSKNGKAQAGLNSACADSAMTLVLDFSQYDLMFDDIRAEAVTAFRTPGQHAMWLISKSLYREAGAK